MTLAEKLAREAAPCMIPEEYLCNNGNPGVLRNGTQANTCSHCDMLPAIQAAIEEAIQACASIALDRYDDVPHLMQHAIYNAIKRLLTNDVEDGR